MNGDNQQQPAPSQAGGQWQYRPEVTDSSADIPTAPIGGGDVAWTASEFVAHHKGLGWYALFTLAAVCAVSIIYFVTRDMVSAGVIVFMAVLFAIAAGRKPRTLAYRVDTQGISIGEKFYPYSEFKSFSINPEGAFGSLTFLPLKRFMPPISIYYSAQDHERILEVITMHLPYEQRQGDWVDRAMKHIRF